MPKAGYVGIRMTPQRKLMLAEAMRNESFTKPTEALDFVLGFATKRVNTDATEIENVNVPDFLNYYVGESAENELTDKATKGALVARNERAEQDYLNHSLTWRRDALTFITNCEPTITNMADAVDFALASYLAHSRSGNLTPEERSELREEVKRNNAQFKETVTQFRKDNMTEQEAEARKNKRKQRMSKSTSNSIANARSYVLGVLTSLYREYHRKSAEGGWNLDSLHEEIVKRETDLARLEAQAAVGKIAEVANEARTSDDDKSLDEIPF